MICIFLHFPAAISQSAEQSTNDPKLAGLNPALLTKGECDEKTWMPEITGSESDLN